MKPGNPFFSPDPSPLVPTTRCRICGDSTVFLGTRLCSPCWELNWRIEDKPDIARKILDALPDSSGSSRPAR